MILGIGVDTVEVKRMSVAMKTPNFITSTFTINEIKNCHGKEDVYYATRFACKEAVFKAIGKPLDWRVIETLNDKNGKPYVVLSNELKNYVIHVSITTEAGLATAFCVAEKN